MAKSFQRNVCVETVVSRIQAAADRRRRELGVPVPGEGEAAPFTERAGATTKANAAGIA